MTVIYNSTRQSVREHRIELSEERELNESFFTLPHRGMGLAFSGLQLSSAFVPKENLSLFGIGVREDHDYNEAVAVMVVNKGSRSERGSRLQ